MAEVGTQAQEPAAARPQFVFLVIQFSGGGAGEDGKPGPAPASKASIEAMPWVKVGESGKDCSICLEEFKVEEEGREMPCKHVFHSGCVEKWLRIHGSCPVCRYLMPVDLEEEESRGGGGQGEGEGGEVGLGFVQSVWAMASLASLMAIAGQAMGSGRSSQHSDEEEDDS